MEPLQETPKVEKLGHFDLKKLNFRKLQRLSRNPKVETGLKTSQKYLPSIGKETSFQKALREKAKVPSKIVNRLVLEVSLMEGLWSPWAS